LHSLYIVGTLVEFPTKWCSKRLKTKMFRSCAKIWKTSW